jgi:hypothetical protein
MHQIKHSRLFILFSLIGLLMFSACQNDDDSIPDEIVVRGQVTDADTGEALAGVTVNSGKEATITDEEGNYAVLANIDGILVFFIEDYSPQSIEVNSRTIIDVALVTSVSDKTRYTESVASITCKNGGDIIVTFVSVLDRGKGTGTVTWTNDKVWLLDGLVFVNEGQTLTIEPGTIIKGKPGQGVRASALVVAQGGTLIAQGTKDAPIIFTAEADDIVKDIDGNPCLSTNLGTSARGLWGGVILLGYAPINGTTTTKNIEGIVSEEPRAIYGGTDNNDSSGLLKYISIRHGGSDLGAGKEINGLTLGGVGRGTSIEFIEVFANNDDGFEWFGGTVNTKYLISAFNGDDGMDYDEGWQGLNQYWLVYQEDAGDKGGEHDGGPTDCITCEPFSTPVIFNASYRGRGTIAGKEIALFRDNAGGEYHNSIFWSYKSGIIIEDTEGEQDAFNQYNTGKLKIENNLFYDIDAPSVIATSTGTVLDLGTNLDLEHNPLNHHLIPNPNSPATEAGSTPEHPFFDINNFKGAFAPEVAPWLSGWSRVEQEL